MQHHMLPKKRMKMARRDCDHAIIFEGKEAFESTIRYAELHNRIMASANSHHMKSGIPV